jgi:hypothetical protein
MQRRAFDNRAAALAILSLAWVTVGRAADDPEDLRGLAKARVDIARHQLEEIERQMFAPPSPEKVGHPLFDLQGYAVWSRRLMEAQLDQSGSQAERAAAIQAHITRLEKWVKPLKEMARGAGAGVSQLDADSLQYQVLEAKSLLIKERSTARREPPPAK